MAVLTSTHDLCFGAKIGIPLHTQFSYIKVGFKGVYITRKCFPDTNRINLNYRKVQDDENQLKPVSGGKNV